MKAPALHRAARRLLPAVLAAVAGAAQAGNVSVSVVDADGRPLPNAVVSVIVKGVRAHAAAGTRAEIAQKDRQFQPQVSVIQTGTAVWFPNFDTVRHHVYSFSPIQRFELRLYAGTPSTPVVFDKPGLATLGCNIHDRMAAWVVVVNTPYFARTDGAGVAALDLPPGEHRLHAWHALLGDAMPPVERPLTVTAAAAARASISLPRREAAP